jgi:hypothetical protein
MKLEWRTWHGEMLVAALVLFAIALINGKVADFVGAGAVLLSFGHMTVAERLREKQEARPVIDVECHRYLTRYLVGKEISWAAYFVMLRSWPALAGCGLFLLYPAWRKLWRRHHPMTPDKANEGLVHKDQSPCA